MPLASAATQIPMGGAPHPSALPDREAALRAAAQRLEASFLAVMLESAGLGAPRDAFGGGVGEEQFSSFLVQLQADALAERGGIGLAEMIFNATLVRQGRGD